MTSISSSIGTLLFGITTMIGSSAANADIHTIGEICQPSHQPLVAGESIQYGSGISNSGRDSANILCAVPRPDIATGASAIFIVQGRNIGGTSSNCGFEILSSSGDFKSIESFTLSGTTSAVAVTIPGTRITNSDHVFLFCTLPGNNGGQIVGFTAVGP